MEERKVRIVTYGVVLVGILIVFCVLLQRPRLDGRTHVYMLNVGQGDSFLIQAANGRQMLIDGGRDATVLSELTKVMPRGDRSIDVVIATHPDADHIGGLPLVFDRYKIGMFLTTEAQAESKIQDTLLEKLIDKNIPSYYARRGMTITLDTTHRDTFSVLFPDRPTAGWETNTASIVGKFSSGSKSMLFTGDSPIAIEQFLARTIPQHINADIVKLGHHGSKTSSSEEYLKAVSSALALISAGVDNSYGHPHKEVTNRLKKLGIPFVSTQEKGTVELVSDGVSWVMK